MTKESAAFLLSATATVLITGSIIAAHVLSLEFKQFLINLTGHHWISVSIIAAILFLLISMLILRSAKLGALLKADDLRMWSRCLVAATLLATLGTFAVYVYTTL